MKRNHQVINTYAYLIYGASWAVEQAEATEEDSMYPSMHAILSSIYALEAFANHIGPRLFGDKWDNPECQLRSIKEKYRALLKEFSISLDDVLKEWNLIMLGLTIRKQLTHGRTHEVITHESNQDVDGSEISTTTPDWIRHCNPQTARKVYEAALSLIRRLGAASGEGDLCWGTMGYGRVWGPTSSNGGA